MIARISVLALISVLVLGGLFVILRPDPPAATPATRSFNVQIRDGAMSPEEVSVRKGVGVNMSITSDRPVEIHIHGYNLEREVGPSGPTEISFQAGLTGRFPIEDHETEEELGVLVVEPR